MSNERNKELNKNEDEHDDTTQDSIITNGQCKHVRSRTIALELELRSVDPERCCQDDDQNHKKEEKDEQEQQQREKQGCTGFDDNISEQEMKDATHNEDEEGFSGTGT